MLLTDTMEVHSLYFHTIIWLYLADVDADEE